MGSEQAYPSPSSSSSSLSSSSSSSSKGHRSSSIGAAVIPIVNRLQDIIAQLGDASTIRLPQVAVVGSQSSGKSSVLEALVGRDFLPRGSDICTRRPLVLQLVHSAPPSEGSSLAAEWGEFLHRPGQRFEDFAEIRREIKIETEREAGTNQGISDKQIRLKIFSPNVLDITLVDLPGITKVPVGNQPSDIEIRIRTMIMSYIKHETCMILAVSPANSDLANSDALQMARIADPNGSRTIGVITKLDIMDRGTDACNFLLGKVIPLRLGYIGVVNRSQMDIIENRSIAEALANEEKFFRSRPVYHSLADRCGIPQLAKKLNQILVQHIRMVLPELKARLNVQMIAVLKELRSYGETIESTEEKRVILLNILTKYCEDFSALVEGKHLEMPTTELSGGSRILHIFQAIFVNRLEEVDPCEDLTDDEIRTAIQNATGTKTALFVPEVPFEVLVRRRIARLLDPSLQCLRFIYDELIKISHTCAVDLPRFPVLNRRLEEVVGKFLRDGVKPAERMIANLIGMEMDYINTSHPRFIGGSKAVEVAMQQLRSLNLTAKNAPKLKDDVDADKLVDKLAATEKGSKSRGFLVKSVVNGVTPDQGTKFLKNNDRPEAQTGNTSGGWGISSLFGGNRNSSQESPLNKPFSEPSLHDRTILLKEPPSTLRPSEERTENETIEIAVTKLLLRSYYDIVRKKIQDAVPKAIMHFLVNHAKRDLLSTFIQKLYREEQFSILLNEREEVAVKRQQTKELFNVLRQAVSALDTLPIDLEDASRGSTSGSEVFTGSTLIPGMSSPVHPTMDADLSSPYIHRYKL
uniref:Dynamin-related protein 3A n=1 Tax=Anthurium amnicola TaxID=1678845 RepID=A0A1D1ZL45_9ARAE